MDKSNSFSARNFRRSSIVETLEDFLLASKKVISHDMLLIGGMNLMLYLKAKGNKSFRPTIDVDFDVKTEETWKHFLDQIPKEISDSSSKGYRYEVEKTRQLGDLILGDTASVVCSNGVRFKVDMNIIGNIENSSVYSEDYPRGATIGRMIADKVKVFLSKRIYRRSKDLYDIYLIANSSNFKLEDISKDIQQRWESVGYPEEPVHLADLDSLKHAFDRLEGIVDKPKFEDVYVKALEFSSTIFLRLTDRDFKGYVWNSKLGIWER